MQKDPIDNKIKEYYETIVGLKYDTIINLINNNTVFREEYYNLEYYLLNTFFWSDKSNKLIWEIFQDFVDCSHDSLLDYGCGCGLYTKRLGSEFQRYLGVDISNTGLLIAQKSNLHNKNISFSSLAEFYNSQKKFDLIFCSETLDHVENPLETLCYLSSRLKPEGQLFLTTTTVYHYIFRILLQDIPKDIRKFSLMKAFKRIFIYFQSLFYFSKRPDLMRVGLDRDDHKNAFTLRQHKHMAKKAGLKIERFEYFTCKDVFSSNFFDPLNILMKKHLRRSKIYGPNIAISFKRYSQ